MDSVLGLLQFLWVLFLVIMVFNFMIIVHEWGHFLAARWRGLQIDKFQIWFGKPIWKKKWNGVQYGLGCIPAGGFVALPQMAPMEMIEGSGDAPREKLPPISPMDKIIVAFAGPLFSFLLACFFAVIVWQIGYPVDESIKTTKIGYIAKNEYSLNLLDPSEADSKLPEKAVGQVAVKKEGEGLQVRIFDENGKKIEGSTTSLSQKSEEVLALVEELEPLWAKKFITYSEQARLSKSLASLFGHEIKKFPAETSDLNIGDEILEIEGSKVKRFQGMVDSVQWGIVSSVNDDIEMKVKGEDGAVRTVLVNAPLQEVDDHWNQNSWWEKLFKRPQLRSIGVYGYGTPLVKEVSPGSPADDAKLQPDDFVETVNGEKMASLNHINEVITSNEGKELTLGVKRGDEKLDVLLTPRVPKSGADRPMIGLAWNIAGNRQRDFPTPMAQVSDAVRMMRNTIVAIFSPKSKIGAGHLAGPIGIGSLYYNLFQHPDGWRLVLWFSVILNINLAIMNMLPFPVLDGGHITMASLEMIRKKPLNTRLLEVVQGAAVILLFGFMIFVTMKDAGGIFRGGGSDKGKSAKEIEW